MFYEYPKKKTLPDMINWNWRWPDLGFIGFGQARACAQSLRILVCYIGPCGSDPKGMPHTRRVIVCTMRRLEGLGLLARFQALRT